MSSDNKSKVRNQYIATLIATGSCLASGMSFGWPSPVETQIVLNGTNGTCDNKICVTRSEFAWIATCMTIGALAFGFFAGPLMSAIGRKRALLCYFVVIIAGWLSLTFANAKWMLYLGRLLTGMGYGGTSIIVPIYVAEIAQTSIRGTLSSFIVTKMATGTMIAYILGFFVDMFMQNLVCTLILAVFGLALFIIPESPRYFAFKDKLNDTRGSLKWLRGSQYEPEKEIQEIIEFQNSQETKGFKAFFKEKTNRRTLLIASCMFVGYEFSGMNSTLFYTTSIFTEADIGIEPSLAVVFAGLCTFAGPIVSIFLVDRTGRKFLLLSSYLVQFLCFVVIGVYFVMKQHDPQSVISWRVVPVVALCTYIFFCSMGCSPVCFVVLGEIFAQNVKDIAAGITMTLTYLASIVVTLIFPYMSDEIGTGLTFLIFSIFNAANFVFVIFFIPETKGKSFQEIQALLSSKKK